MPNEKRRTGKAAEGKAISHVGSTTGKHTAKSTTQLYIHTNTHVKKEKEKAYLMKSIYKWVESL